MASRTDSGRLSRRGFLGAGTAATLVSPALVPVLLGSTAAEAADSPPRGDAYLRAAQQAAHWIRTAEVPRETGITWLPDPDHPEKPTTVGPDNTVYSGGAGIVLFFLELAAVTGDSAYLADAQRGADYLAASWRKLPDGSTASPLRDRGLSFDQGLAGTAFALTEVWKVTKTPAYRQAALEATHALAKAARPAGNGVEWASSPAVGLDGGIVLYLLSAAHTFDDQTLLHAAVLGGNRILQLGQSDSHEGLWWQGLPKTQGAAPAGIPANTYFPNFELGTAGVAFVLARLYEETHDARYLEAAKAGARHIQRIATVRDDSALVYYREPDLKDLYYLGYCHGPAGTARLFYQLHKVTGAPEYSEWTEKLARGVINSGVPEKLTPGYWNVACQCCGAAAEVDFFLSLWLTTGKSQYRQFAQRVADQLISRETDLDGHGYRWYQAWTRVRPWEVNAETGYKIGASGIGSALLHTHLAAENRYSAILFPDNPFPRSQRT